MKKILIYKTKNKNGAVLLLSLIITIFLSILLGAVIMRSDVQLKEVIQLRTKQESFYAAEAGIDDAIYNLRQNAAWKPGEGGDPPVVDKHLDVAGKTIGFYSLTVVDDGQKFNSWDTRVITSRGKDSRQIITRTIHARVIVESPTRFLISTLGPLHVTSGSTLNADTLAKDVFFDVNTSLADENPNKVIQLNGDVLYINSVTGEKDANGNPNPSVRYLQGKSSQKTPSITFAGVDLNRYETLAQNLQTENMGYYSSESIPSLNLSNLSALNNNPGFSPQIIYANGDIHITGDYDKSVLVVAAGNIYIDGNIVPNDTVLPRPQIGLFAKGNVIIPPATATTGELNIEGFVLADGGAFYADGPKYSKNQLNFTGAISVRGNGTSAVDLNVFTNRKYDFNPSLNYNRSIPFTPFIVNTVRWEECNPVCNPSL